MELIKNELPKVENLCKTYHVTQLYVFGSFARNNFRDDSDIDFLVYFDKNIPLLDYADNFFDFIYSLENLFHRRIDMVSGKAIKNPYFKQEIENTKQLIYDYNQYNKLLCCFFTF